MEVDTLRQGAFTHQQTRPHLPAWAKEAVANENVERSKSPQDVTPKSSQRPANLLPPLRHSSRQQSLQGHAVKSRPTQQQPSEPQSSVPQAGDSAENALVID